MNNNITRLQATVATALALIATTAFAASGSVTLSGSTWTGSVDGSTKYTGTSMAAAANACVSAMSSGTVSISAAGNKNGTISTKSSVIIDATGKTISGSGTLGMCYSANASSTGGKNFNQSTSDWYGIYFRTCNGVTATGNNGTSNLSFRVDNCKGGTGYNLNISGTSGNTSSSHGSHHVETYGISSVTLGSASMTDRTDGCGTLFNYSSNCSGSNNGTRCCWGGGYAGYRTANTNGKSTMSSVSSTSCGRGYFSVSGSKDCTVSTISVSTTSSTGIWLQTTYNTKVNGGTVRSGNPCSSISAGSGNTITVTCQ